MDVDDIATLFGYNCWATEKIMKETANLSTDQLIDFIFYLRDIK